MRPVFRLISLACLLSTAFVAATRADELKFKTEEIDASLKVGYAVALVDVNSDGRPDIVVVDTQRVIWFENPTWKLHTMISGATQRDNVCIAPHDMDGDGQIDFALGAGWRGFNTTDPGTVQWLTRGESPADPWIVRAIGEEPSVHRVRWANVDDDDELELVVVPLLGRGTTPPDFDERPVRILAYDIPADPAQDRWPMRVLNEELHVAHNGWPTDLDQDGRTDLLIASFEGVSLLTRSGDGGWSRKLIGSGNQESSPSRGTSEIKHGRLRGGGDYLATIEPWHGFQVVVYTPPGDDAAEMWQRRVLDDQLKWGHAVWCANLDGDEDEELIIGVRDTLTDDAQSGLRIYDPPASDAAESKWSRQLVDPGGVAIEDLAVADLNNDGRADVVAVGRQTHNVRIYWNEGR